MPKRLLERCQPDSIAEFRAAARKRYDDARALDAAQHRQLHWSETLRYHKNVAYNHELVQVRRAASWLFVHASLM